MLAQALRRGARPLLHRGGARAQPAAWRPFATGGDAPGADDGASLRVDRAGLGRAGYPKERSVPAPATALGKELASQIEARGPVSVYEYMKQSGAASAIPHFRDARLVRAPHERRGDV